MAKCASVLQVLLQYHFKLRNMKALSFYPRIVWLCFFLTGALPCLFSAGGSVSTGAFISFNKRTGTVKPVLRLNLLKGNFNDETVFYFEEGGAPGFQSDFDAYKLISSSSTLPYIASLSGSVIMSINGLPPLPANLSVPVKAITHTTGVFEFSGTTTDFPENICVTLYDAYTGTSTNILTTSYTCTLYDTTSAARFTINFFTTSLNVATQLVQAGCMTPNGGMIIAQVSGVGPWNYEWKKGDSIVKSSLNKTTVDSLTSLNGGQYTVKISGGQCANFNKSFTLDSIVAPVSLFDPDVYVTTLSHSGRVNFNNYSDNARFSIWDFGDNSGTWFVPEPSHNYSSAGIYTVTLVSESIHHCMDTAVQTIEVIDDITGISLFGKDDAIRLCSVPGRGYELRFRFSEAADLGIEISDLNGTIISTSKFVGVIEGSHPVDLDSRQGLYLMNVSSGNGKKTFRLIQ